MMRSPLARALALVSAGMLAASLLSGCSSPASPRFIEETSVFGMLYVGETLSANNAIVIMHTRPVDQPYDLQEAAVRGAVVLLQAEGAPTPDTLRMLSPGRYADPAITIAAHTTYHLTIRDGARTITATTITPAPFTVLQGPVVAPATMPHAAIAQSYPIVLDGPDPEQIMLVDTYCLETYQNAFYVNPIGTHDRPKDDKEYGGAQTPPRNTFFYFRLGDLPVVPGGYRLGFYGDMMQFYGAYTLGLFAIDTNYYNFLFREQPESHSGVLGGIGVFGSAARTVWQVKTTR